MPAGFIRNKFESGARYPDTPVDSRRITACYTPQNVLYLRGRKKVGDLAGIEAKLLKAMEENGPHPWKGFRHEYQYGSPLA